VQGVTLAPLAVLLELDALRIALLVLFGRVITALALGAGQGDQCSHLNTPLINNKAQKQPDT
jgi:hypothetical protein